MLGLARALLQTLYMPGVIALFPAVKSLGTDIIVAAGETSIVPLAVIVVKPFQSLPGFFR